MPIASSLLKKPRFVKKLKDFYDYVRKNDGKVGTKTRGIDLCHTAFSWYSSTNAERAYIVNYGCPPPGWTINTGNADANGYGNFEHAVPTGYYALCTKNLAEFG